MPVFQVAVSDLTGIGTAVRVSTLANGVAPVRGTVSLVAYGVPREVRPEGCEDIYCVATKMSYTG